MIPGKRKSFLLMRSKMSHFRSISLMRLTSLLGVVLLLATASASAQSSPSPTPFTSNLVAANESSSLSFMADDSLGGAAARPSSAAAGGASQEEQGWKHKVTRNFAFEVGGGFNGPIGNDTSSSSGGPFITWGGNFTVGGGLHFNKYLSMLAEYQFIGDKLPGSFIAEVGTQGGNAHIWSFTLAPVVDLFPKRTNSIYVTGGGGFYRKVTNFTNPEDVEYCDYYCEIYSQNETVYHFSSNQGGMNLGFGITHRLGGVDGKAKLFAEARYLFLDTPGINSTTGTGTTELIPVTFGVRW
jgi:hypothetical protein